MILEIFWSSKFFGAIMLTITLILVGYLFTKHNVFKTNPSQILSSIAMKLALPCLAFCGFMSDFDVSQFGIFLISFIGFGLLFLLGRLFFIRVNKDDKDLCRICFAIGQVSLIGLPIVKVLYGQEAVTYSNMILLSFRLYLYIYAFFLISKLELNKENIKLTLKKSLLNPIMIAMLIGFIFYLTQLFIPQITIHHKSSNEDALISIFRIDQSLPNIYYVIDTIGDMASPISMLLVGASLASIDLKGALKNKLAWYTSFLRSFIAPLVIIGLILLYNLIFKGTDLALSRYAMVTIVILFSAPVSVTVNTLTVEYKRNYILTSDTVFLTTLISIASMPLFMLLSEIIIR